MPVDMCWNEKMGWWEIWRYRDGFFGWQWYMDEVRDRCGRPVC